VIGNPEHMLSAGVMSSVPNHPERGPGGDWACHVGTVKYRERQSGTHAIGKSHEQSTTPPCAVRVRGGDQAFHLGLYSMVKGSRAPRAVRVRGGDQTFHVGAVTYGKRQSGTPFKIAALQGTLHVGHPRGPPLWQGRSASHRKLRLVWVVYVDSGCSNLRGYAPARLLPGQSG
jgi:hypothetical protein